MRAQLTSLPLCALLLIACDGGGSCFIDSDCADFTNVCIDRTCVPAGTVTRDAGRPRDAGPPDEEDAGPFDGGPFDGGPFDGGDAGPMCTDVAGNWAITV